MRKRPNLGPRMEKCSGLMIAEAQELRGKWLDTFPGNEKLYLEIGCGKGRFTVETASQLRSTLYIAIEKVPDAMVIAMERVRDRQLDNVRFIDGDAAGLSEMFADGEIDRIYINFCDPWPKSRDAKFRLTAPGFLRLYGNVLPTGGEIHFKTDNTPLFNWSIEQLRSEDWELSELTNDLHADGICGIMTDYEEKFHAQGIKINRLIARKTALTKTTADGPVPRLYNAALTDARGFEQSMADNGEEK